MSSFLVIYKGVDNQVGPLSIAGSEMVEPSDAAKYVWDNCMNKMVDAHISDKIYVFPADAAVTFSVKGLVTLERD